MNLGKLCKVEAFDEVVYSRRDDSDKIVILIQEDPDGYFCHILCEDNSYEEGEFFNSLFKAVLWSNDIAIDLGYKITDPFIIPDYEYEIIDHESLDEVYL